MLSRNHPDRIQITFDDRRLVANAGLLLPATLARHLGLPELVQQRLDLGDAPGRANAGDKMLTLVASALAGGDCIDDADALRAGGTARTLGGTVGLDDLFEGDGRVDLRGVLFDPVRFQGRVLPVVEWLFEVGDGTDDAVEDHLARCDAVAGPDGSVFWVGFVYVGQDGGELGSVVGDF